MPLGAPSAQLGVGRVQRLASLLPLAAQERRRPGGALRKRLGLEAAALPRQVGGEGQERALTPTRRSSQPRALRRLEGGGAQDRLREAGAQREHEELCLHAGREQDVDDREAHRSGVQRLDPVAILGRHVRRLPRAEAQAGEQEPCPIHDDPEDEREPRARRVEADGGEDPMQHARPLVDPARRQELVGGGSLELHTAGPDLALRRREVRARGLGAAPGQRERLREAQPHADGLGSLRISGLEGGAKQAHGAVERGVGHCALRGALGEGQGASRVRRAEEVDRDGLGVGVGAGLQGPGEPLVAVSGSLGGGARQHGVADALVDRLDDVVAVAHPDAHEARSAQERDGPRRRIGDDRVTGPRLRASQQHGHRQRTARDRDQLEQRARRLRQARDPPRDDVVEADRRASGIHVAFKVRFERAPRRGAGSPDSRATAPPPSRARRRPPRRAGRAPGASPPPSSSGRTTTVRASAPSGHAARSAARKGLVVASSSPVRHEDEQGRGVRRPHELEEQGGAVGVAPVCVVDEDDERLAARRARETARAARRRPAGAAPRVADRRVSRASAISGTRRRTGKSRASAHASGGRGDRATADRTSARGGD